MGACFFPLYIGCLFAKSFLIRISIIRCRKGTAQILVDFDDFSVKIKEAATGKEKGVLGNSQICGKDVPRGYWVCMSVILPSSLRVL